MFYEFNSLVPFQKNYKGYQLLACDGSDLNIARNPKDTDTYFQSQAMDRGYNQIHLNALYDLCEKRYTNVLIQPARKENESLAMTLMIDRCQGQNKTIFIADRGYEIYNIFAHVQEKGMHYLIRVKDGGKSSMTGSFMLPDEDEFDHSMQLVLIRKQTNEIKANPEQYKFLPKTSSFDYLDSHDRKFYTLNFRVVRFAVSEDSYESIITNLHLEEFPAEEIKKIYKMRGGIETSFRELKYAIGLSCFHSKKVEYIMQEIYARLILYN
ncbi:IS4 family transposase [Blautia sp. JLR.GB0024]|uniref:IS4 family transposase n=1 Tax=Blautia sp. JLR.GB0024 TaxID=3123295 RepID=UPI0030053F72